MQWMGIWLDHGSGFLELKLLEKYGTNLPRQM